MTGQKEELAVSGIEHVIVMENLHDLGGVIVLAPKTGTPQ